MKNSSNRFLFLLFASQLFSYAFSANIKALNEGEGLRFEKIGDFRLITQLHELTFNVNLTEITQMINEYEDVIQSAYGFNHTDDTTKIKYEKDLTRILQLSKQQSEIFEDFRKSSKSEKSKRTKRSSDWLSGAYYLFGGVDEQYTNAINELRIFTNEAINATRELYVKFFKTVKIQELTNYQQTKQVILNEIALRAYVVKSKIRAIISMQQRRRLSSVFVSFSQFNDTLQNLTKFLGHDEKMPFTKVNEYFYSLEMTHSVEGDSMILKVKVPIVEKLPRELYKIHEIPSYFGKHLLITNVEWKYMAVGEKDVVKMKSLDECHKVASSSSFFCDFQSPIMNKMDHSDCLINAFEEKKINFGACKTSAADFSQLIFIKLGNGEYFYYKPKLDDVKVTIICNGSSTVETLIHQTGILQLEQGCSASTNKSRLISTRTYSTQVSSSIKVGFKDNRLGQSLDELFKTPKQSDFLKQYRKNQEDIPKVEKQHEHSQQPKMAGSNIALIVMASSAIIVIVLIVVKQVVMRKCLNKKTEDDSIKIILET